MLPRQQRCREVESASRTRLYSRVTKSFPSHEQHLLYPTCFEEISGLHLFSSLCVEVPLPKFQIICPINKSCEMQMIPKVLLFVIQYESLQTGFVFSDKTLAHSLTSALMKNLIYFTIGESTRF